jgi:mRNA interferase HigB
MLIVGQGRIEQFLRKHAAARTPMARWFEITAQAEWHSIVDVRQSFRHADAVKGTALTCFNIGGNHYRLLTIVSYDEQIVSIVEPMTHSDYDKKYA